MARRGTRDEDRKPGRDARKDGQLCNAVAEAVSMALGAECDDPGVSSLWVREVVPWPDTSRLLVILESPEGEDAAELEEKLVEWEGMIRSEVAAAIQRKKTPLLTYRVLPAGATKVEDD
ncbi:MAG: ribosome-binding factor A [Polyangiales bacterium]